MSTAAAVILIREKKVVRAFREANAVSADSARTLDQLGLREDRAVGRLKRRSVLQEGQGGRLYLDELAWAESRRRRLMVVATLVVVALLAVAWSAFQWTRAAR